MFLTLKLCSKAELILFLNGTVYLYKNVLGIKLPTKVDLL